MNAKLARTAGLLLALAAGATLGVVLLQASGLGDALGLLRSSHNSVPEATGTDSIPVEYQGELSLFILAGQSNIAGRGPVPEWARVANSRVFVFGNDYRWRIAVEPIDDPAGQVDAVSLDPDAGMSPGVAFASALLSRRPELTVGLIPCARGGTSIHAWRRNLRDDTLYGSCLKRVRVASSMGEVRGILFFQGEEDAMDSARFGKTNLFPDEWADRFGKHPLK